MVQLSPSVTTPKRAKAKTPKKNSAVNTPAKLEMKTPKQKKQTPVKAALQISEEKEEALVEVRKSTPKISTLQTPKTSKSKKKASMNEPNSTPKAAPKTHKNVMASACKNKKAKTPKHEKPGKDLELKSEGEEEAEALPPSHKMDVNNSEDAEMSSEEEKIEAQLKSIKSADKKGKSKKVAGKRKLEDSNQSGGDQKRQKITFDNEIFIARLRYKTSEDTLKEHFSQFGEVVNVGMPLKPNKQLNKGFAFVAFKDASSMKKAMADTNQKIDAAKIVIQAKKKMNSKELFPKPSHPNELFVGGLDNSTQKLTLEEHFSQYGRVGNVSLPWNQKASKNKGYGFVSFESPASLQSALQAEHEIDGKRVGVHAAGKNAEENCVVSKVAKTKKVKAALTVAKVEEEEEEEEEDDEDEIEEEVEDEIEGEEIKDEEGGSDDEDEEDEEEVEGELKEDDDDDDDDEE